ncbi:MAG: hypothetical protein ABI886_10105 [Betaproteobacteria bacterium]
MEMKTWAPAVAVTAILLGGAFLALKAFPEQFKTATARTECTKKQCDVYVKFKLLNWDLVIDYDLVEVKKGNDDVEIVWHLPKNKVYRFDTADGVVLKYPDPAPNGDDDGQIDQRWAMDDHGTQMQQGVDYHWRTKNTTAKSYLYVITVTDPTTTPNKKYVLDPTIRNQGH